MPRIRIFALWLSGQDELSEWSWRCDCSRCLKPLAASLEVPVGIARSAGVTLMIELEGASYVGRVDEARRLLRLVDAT